MPASEAKSDDGRVGDVDVLGNGVDMATFSQILEMDDSEDDREFSQSIVAGFFEQAEETFESMDAALKDEDLEKLSQLGHFLKGSSATLGLVKVRDSCEKIQRYGKKEDEEGNPVDDEALCLKKTGETLKTLRIEYDEVEAELKKFFGI